MKKIYFVLCALVLAGCAKKADVKPDYSKETAVVTFNFKGSVSGENYIYYIDPNSPNKTPVKFSGTEWTKTDTIKTGSYANGSNFLTAIGTTLLPQGTTYTLTISVNGTVESNGSYPSNTIFAYQSYNYQVYHQVSQ